MSVWDGLRGSVDIDQDVLDKFADSFNRGMVELVKKLSDGTPIPTLSFPSVSGGVAVRASGSTPFDTILLPVCWGAGLTPRSCQVQPSGNAFLRFLPDPLAEYATFPASVDTLQKGATPKTLTSLPAGQDDQNDFVIVETLLPLLEQLFGINRIQAHPFSLRQWVSLRLPASACFTQVMDAVALSLTAHWTWAGDGVYLGPPEGGGDGCRGSADQACSASSMFTG